MKGLLLMVTFTAMLASLAEAIPTRILPACKRSATRGSGTCFMSAMHPGATKLMRRNELPLCANSVLTHRSKKHRYSITSSAVASSVGGTVRPSSFAVARLMTSSNFDACITGRSAGLAPLRMRPA